MTELSTTGPDLFFMLRGRFMEVLQQPRAWSSAMSIGRALERAGWSGILIPEHHQPAHDFCPSPLILASAILGATERIMVGPGVLPVGLYSSRLFDDLSVFTSIAPGRAIIGLGTGFLADDFQAVPGTGPAPMSSIRALAEGMAAGGVDRNRILIGAVRPENLAWAGANGFGVLIGGPWVRRTRFAAQVAAYDRSRRAAGGSGYLAILVGIGKDFALGGAEPDWPAPVREDAVWLDSTLPVSDAHIDAVVAVPFEVRASAEALASQILSHLGRSRSQ